MTVSELSRLPYSELMHWFAFFEIQAEEAEKERNKPRKKR